MTSSSGPATEIDEPTDANRPLVLVTAETEVGGRRAIAHADDLFGEDHRIVVLGGDPAEAVCDRARDCRAAAIVVGVDLGGGQRTAVSRALRILRRSPCPVVMVAT